VRDRDAPLDENPITCDEWRDAEQQLTRSSQSHTFHGPRHHRASSRNNATMTVGYEQLDDRGRRRSSILPGDSRAHGAEQGERRVLAPGNHAEGTFQRRVASSVSGPWGIAIERAAGCCYVLDEAVSASINSRSFFSCRRFRRLRTAACRRASRSKPDHVSCWRACRSWRS
jgi:hypothetical protein